MSVIVQTGFQLATAVISNGAITGNQWSNPNNLLLTDGHNAESNPNGGVASDVVIGNFNAANVPSNAVITGIEIELIGAYSGAPTSPSITITPYFLDNTSGSDVYYPYVTPQVLTVTPTDYVLGSSTYLFGTSFTPDQINNAKIQLVANGDVNIDAVKINVFYFIPDVPVPPPPPGNTCVDCDSPLQVPPLFLALPFLSGDRYAFLQSFNYADGTPVLFSDMGSCGGLVKFVFDPGLVRVGGGNFMENAQTAVWTTLTNGYVQLDFDSIAVNRGLMFHTPYTADSALRSNHDANSKVVISDSGPFFGQYLQKCQIGALVSAPIQTFYNNSLILNPTVKFNFTGPGVVVTTDVDPLKVNIFIPGNTPTPPTVVNSLSFFSDTAVSSFTTPVFNITGTDRWIGVDVTVDPGVTITGALFNGITVNIDAFASQPGFTVYALDQVAPSLGTHTLNLTFSGPTRLAGNMVLYNQVDQSTPIVGTTANVGTSTLATLNVTTTTTNSIVFHAFGTAHFPMLYTAGGGESIVAQTVAGQLQGGIENQSVGTPTTVTTQVNLSVSTDWASVAFAINGIQPPPITGLVLVDSSDTTPDFLAAKINVHSSDSSVTVSTTVTSPGGDEVLDIDLTAAGGSGGSGIFQTVHQVAHGFTQGQIIKSSGVANTYALALGDNAVDAEVVGIVTTVIDVDNFIYSQDIMGYAGAAIPVGTAGEGIFLDQSTPGAMTLTPDLVTSGLIVKPIGVLIATAAKMNFSSSYLGLINP